MSVRHSSGEKVSGGRGWKIFWRIFWGAIVVWILGASAWEVTHPPPPETQEQTQARVVAQRAAQAAYETKKMQDLVVAERKRNLCNLQAVCTKYGDTRQSCATAGNYNTCLNVKMSNDIGVVSLCTNDGRIANPPNDMPNTLECLLTKIP
jgi:hypothetical protein